MPEKVVPGPVSDDRSIREAVCIHTKKIFDSCRDKDCVEDLRVYPTRCSQEVIDRAQSIKAGSAELLYAYIDVEPVTFNRGFFTVDVRYFYRITADAFVGAARPVQVCGLAVFSKRAVLFGSESSSKSFTSEENENQVQCVPQSNLPTAVVEDVMDTQPPPVSPLVSGTGAGRVLAGTNCKNSKKTERYYRLLVESSLPISAGKDYNKNTERSLRSRSIFAQRSGFMSILVCGGAGYIGSHTCVELLQAGYDIVVADNLSNSCQESLVRVEKITGKKVPFFKTELCDEAAVEALFAQHPDIDAVIHFAGLKAVGESVAKPLEYYSNNLISTLYLLQAMRRHGVKNFVFSSSATVYGDPAAVPIREEFPTGGTTNPYGTSKLFQEKILMDICAADPELNVALLRYFNPIGAHESGLIGEDPNGIPNNLVPYIAKVAVGQLEKVHVFGNDYPTPDGTGVRDYIHVVDLAKGHVAALKKLTTKCGLFVCNLGTGNGYSVMEVLRAYERACGRELPYVVDPRRSGDIAACYADPAKAKEELGWEAQLGIEEMCASSWKWQSQNPNGYKG